MEFFSYCLPKNTFSLCAPTDKLIINKPAIDKNELINASCAE